MGPLGMTEILVLLLVALILFGPRKLPELSRMVGRGLAEFRRASNDLKATVEDEIRNYEATIEQPGATRAGRAPSTGSPQAGEANPPATASKPTATPPKPSVQ